MIRLQFKVVLKTDIIINQKSATEGANRTLDFIPGSNFLGIVAGKLYAILKSDKNSELTDKDVLAIIHSGDVRFGDAHLAHCINENDMRRCHKVPTVMFHPKLKTASEELYINYAIPSDDETQKKMRENQLKQCRSGFYDFTEQVAPQATAGKTFAIKSAHDLYARTSKEKKMYGYESLAAGSTMLFEVEVEDEKYAGIIREALIGLKHIGRSRSAQYGLVDISEESYREVVSHPRDGQEVTVYADSRLIFLDKDSGMPHFHPEATDLGFEGGEVDWDKSQIRTFQYAPWNFKRQCFDTDRCGIEKGSVLVIKDAKGCPESSQYVGAYRNEGFGRVIYNPDFLAAEDESGRARCRLAEAEKSETQKDTQRSGLNTQLLNFLERESEREEEEFVIYSEVNKWVNKYKDLFKGEAFPSQWGTIRRLASDLKANREIHDQLFFEPQKETDARKGYLMHGVAQQKWNERGRIKHLRQFVENPEFKTEPMRRLAVVNLAAEMAKRCRKEDKK